MPRTVKEHIANREQIVYIAVSVDSGGAGQQVGVFDRHDVIEFAGKHPGAVGVDPVGQSQRFNRAERRLDRGRVDPSFGEFLAEVGRILFALHQHVEQVAARQENENAVKTAVQAGGRGGYESA